MSEVINAANITVLKDKREILRVEEIILHKGECLSVIGPNGAGKTTLLLTLAMLIPPDTGQISFMGEPATPRRTLAIRRRMAVVFQEPLLLNTSVFNNVAQGLRFRGVPKPDTAYRVEYWLERMGISHLAGRNARFLSGGEAQRVSLARALVLEPEVLFLDEPFTALDYSTRWELIEELSEIVRENGITTFFVTHDYSEIAFFAGKVVVLNGGRVVYRGNTGSLFNGDLNELAVSLRLIPPGRRITGPVTDPGEKTGFPAKTGG